MTKEEFFTALDKLLRPRKYYDILTYQIIDLLQFPTFNDENQTYLTEYLANAQHKQLNSYQIDIFWALANSYNNTPLMDALIELNEGKADYDLLTYLLEQSWYKAFEHVIQLYDDSYDKLYNLIGITTLGYDPPEFNDQAINYLLNIAQPQSLPKQNLSNLLYDAIDNNPRMAEALIQHGWDPFGGYWEEDINTGVPILFVAVQSYDGFDFIEQHNDTQEWWNTLDQWGRNLLHFATKQEDYYDLLVEKGVDPDHRAIIDDQDKVTLAKIKGTLPPEYGKTPREMMLTYVNEIIKN